MEILNDSKYTEFYITNKKEGEQLFFKVDSQNLKNGWDKNSQLSS